MPDDYIACLVTGVSTCLDSSWEVLTAEPERAGGFGSLEMFTFVPSYFARISHEGVLVVSTRHLSR